MANNQTAIQSSLSAGEISPSLFGRTDLPKWKEGTSTCRNFFVDYRGGIISRPGTVYVGRTKSLLATTPPRLIPFQFNLTQGYCLEFGDLYMRVIYQGGYVTEASKNITGLTTANPGVFTCVAHGFSIGDNVYIDSIGGITQFNGLTWTVGSTPTADTFTLHSLFGIAVNTTTYGTYTSGGTISRIYTATSPYAAVDLPYLKYEQSADTMTITCVNKATGTEYAPYDLARITNTNWTFTANNFAATLPAPTNLTAKAQSSNTVTTWYSYVVTAVSSTTGEESNPSTAVALQNNDIAIYAGTNTLSWNAVTGADSYNIYAATPSYGQQLSAGSLYGFIGVAFGTNFSDTNIEPDYTTPPPNHSNPFARGAITDVVITARGTNYSQQTVSYVVTTGTGTGFAGTPVVSNGAISGFVIQDRGKGYLNGDTIAFNDSGGGYGTGNFVFGSNPVAARTIIFNGFTVTFASSEATLNGKNVNLGATLATTLQNLAGFLNGSSNGNLLLASYSSDATHLYVTYKTPGATGNTYTLNAGSSGATASAATLTSGGTVGASATATLTVGPQTGTYPSAVAYYQQRRVYASSTNFPDTYWMTQPGLFQNMDTSIPTTGADALTGTPFAQQVNGINWLKAMPGGLVVFTGSSAWQVNGGSSAAITAATQVATPQAFNGCNGTLPVLRVNYDLIYVQSKGNRVRDLSYNWWIQIYTGIDLTAFSNHLVDGYSLVEWCYAEEPFHTIWAIRNDGILLCLTYIKEGDFTGGAATNLYSWTRHDTDGLFVSCCSVSEPPIDAVYFVVKRYIQGGWRYYIERQATTLGENGITAAGSHPEDFICQDASLQNISTFSPDTTHKPAALLSPASAAVGTGVVFTTDAAVFSSGDVGKIIRAGGGQATVTAYTSTTSVTATITIPITLTVPNDPNNQPIPIPSGSWTISTPITTIGKLNHLRGITVSIVADGVVKANQVVSEITPGVFGVTISPAASYVSVGLPYTCQAQTLYLNKTDADGTMQTKRKAIAAVGLRVENSRGLQIGADQVDASFTDNTPTATWTNLVRLDDHGVPADGNTVPLFTGDYYRAIPSGWRTTGQVAIQQSYPLPAKILACVAYFNVGEDT